MDITDQFSATDFPQVLRSIEDFNQDGVIGIQDIIIYVVLVVVVAVVVQ